MKVYALVSALVIATPALAAPRRKRIFKVYTPEQIRHLEDGDRDDPTQKKTKQPKPAPGAKTKKPKPAPDAMSMTSAPSAASVVPVMSPTELTSDANDATTTVPMIPWVPNDTNATASVSDETKVTTVPGLPWEVDSAAANSTAGALDNATAAYQEYAPGTTTSTTSDVVETIPPSPAPMRAIDPTDVVSSPPTIEARPVVGVDDTLTLSPSTPSPTILVASVVTTGIPSTLAPTQASTKETEDPVPRPATPPTARNPSLVVALDAPESAPNSGMILGTTLAALIATCVAIFI